MSRHGVAVCCVSLSLLTPGSVLLVLPPQTYLLQWMPGKVRAYSQVLTLYYPWLSGPGAMGQGNRSSGLVGLLSKGESFLISKNQLTQRDSLSLVREPLVARASRIQKIINDVISIHPECLVMRASLLFNLQFLITRVASAQVAFCWEPC